MKAVSTVFGLLSIVAGVGVWLGWDKINDRFKSKDQPTPAALVRIRSIPAKLVYIAGRIGLDILMQETSTLGLDPKAILATVLDGEPREGLPPGDIPVFMVVYKKTNKVQHWKLTDNVREFRLKHPNPGQIELKVLNEKPLRIELWLESEQEVLIDIELKDSTSAK